jgi:hypothetical protein
VTSLGDVEQAIDGRFLSIHRRPAPADVPERLRQPLALFDDERPSVTFLRRDLS